MKKILHAHIDQRNIRAEFTDRLSSVGNDAENCETNNDAVAADHRTEMSGWMIGGNSSGEDSVASDWY